MALLRDAKAGTNLSRVWESGAGPFLPSQQQHAAGQELAHWHSKAREVTSKLMPTNDRCCGALLEANTSPPVPGAHVSSESFLVTLAFWKLGD